MIPHRRLWRLMTPRRPWRSSRPESWACVSQEVRHHLYNSAHKHIFSLTSMADRYIPTNLDISGISVYWHAPPSTHRVFFASPGSRLYEGAGGRARPARRRHQSYHMDRTQDAVQRRRSSSRWLGSHRWFSRKLRPPLKMGPIWRTAADDRPLVLRCTGFLSGPGRHVPGRHDEAVCMAEIPTESDGYHVNV
ncbi:hypothetical protein BC827DRAFT_955523 [Russula dissimulans]|nr:hypothetical protein BC827DRAFT_955523 [Russula dissimulans]